MWERNGAVVSKQALKLGELEKRKAWDVDRMEGRMMERLAG